MTNSKSTVPAFFAVILTLTLAPAARAQCGQLRSLHTAPSGWHQQVLGPEQARLISAALEPGPGHELISEDIVGLWHVKYVSEGSQGIPDGTVIDAGYEQWHSDGTEILNSGGHAPITSNFCLGVWEKVEQSRYKLNHLAIAWNATGDQLIGPATIHEEVTVDPDHDHFSGTFTNDLYDESGNNLAHAVGNVTGVRIKVGTPVTSVF